QLGLDAMAKGARLSIEDKSAIKNLAEQLNAVQFNQPGDEGQFYKHLARVVEQYADYITPMATTNPNEKNDLRDKYMAENCEWLYQLANDRIVISSHCEHLSKKINNTGITRAGIYLNEKFRNDYYLLGLCFNSGKIKSQPNSANPTGVYEVPEVTALNNSDALFAQCNAPNFLL